MDLFCGQCDTKLTRSPLSQAGLNSACGKDEQPLLDDGLYLLAEEIDLMPSCGTPEPVLITHYVSTTCLLLVDHPAPRPAGASRFQGCCGPSQNRKYNQVCWKCKYEIGVMMADCMGPHFTAINLERLNTQPKWS